MTTFAHKHSFTGVSLKTACFLSLIVNLSQYIQDQTIQKCEDHIPSKNTQAGLLASVCASYFIIKSEWGKHPLAGEKFVLGDSSWEYGNNLALLKADKHWKHSVIEYQGEAYKSYTNWSDFAVDFSDQIAWDEQYLDLLKTSDVLKQVDLMSKREVNQLTYKESMIALIKGYRLWRFDLA